MNNTMARWFVASAVLLVAGFSRAATDRPVSPMGARLAVAPNEDLLFVVGGDNRPTGRNAPVPRVTRAIFSEIRLIRPDFVLWSGDAVYGYGDSPRELSTEYDRFASVVSGAGVPLFNVPGNHEIHHRDGESCEDRGSETEFVRRFGNLYGSFDAGGAHFIALDTAQVCSEDRMDSAQVAWLERDLEANKNARAIFVFTHTEFFSSPTIDADDGKSHPEIQGKAELIALFRRYPVRAVFSGHEHLFSHEARDGIDYFISGGAGAPLYAPPEKGGFSHYVVVRLTGATARYDVIEPGHLYVETGPDLAGKPTTWVVNGNDLDIPLRGATIDAPRGSGSCAGLLADSNLRNLDGTPVPVPVATTACGRVNGKLRLTLSLIAPRRRSVPISVRHRN